MSSVSEGDGQSSDIKEPELVQSEADIQSKGDDSDNFAEDLSEETASSSSQEHDVDGDLSLDDDDDEEEEESMPLLSYTRLFGSLPRRQPTAEDGSQSRTFAMPSTCAVMGKVIITPDNPTTTDSLDPTSSTDPQRAEHDDESPDSIHIIDPLLSQRPHYVVATGFADGSVALVDASTGVAVVPSDQIRLRDPSHAEPVVDLSFDSSGTHLAAVDEGRMACIWEFKYCISTLSTLGNTVDAGIVATTPARDAGSHQPSQSPSMSSERVFSNLMSAFKGSTPAAPSSGQLPNLPATEQSTDHAVNTTTPLSTSPSLPRLATSSVQMSRISYPRSFGIPTCIAIDPSYKRKREKAVLTGFLDGRLVLTKRGFVFQRRTDAIIYQGTYGNDGRGIEAIEWRGSLAVWADATGIRLFDTETLTRIAHIDRPTGARPSLYPTLSSLRPSLLFETSNYLLVAWGDCLMGLSITDHSQLPESSQSPAVDASPPLPQQSLQHQSQQTPAIVRRRTVECAMAWELDCVASGVVPLDSDNVLVLGVVPPVDDVGGDDNMSQLDNDVELQVIARGDGSIKFSNILPVLKNKSRAEAGAIRSNGVTISESAADYRLLSSFALPRMEDVYELPPANEQTVDDFDMQVSLFSPVSQKRKFIDSHLNWNLETTACEAGIDDDDHHHHERDDTESVDSDDYGFIFRPLKSSDEATDQDQRAMKVPPQVIIASDSDMILARMRDVDDAVAHALAKGKNAVALRRALKQKRRLRKYKISDLVNNFFSSLLRRDPKTSKPLSIGRLKVAAKAMPVLFGNDTVLWERWVSEVEAIPGGLFVIAEYLPVRDPKLSSELYGRVLEKMLYETLALKASEAGDEVVAKAEHCFLITLVGWGPTDFLKEHIKLCSPNGEQRNSAAVQAETRFAYRFMQSAANYLQFPVPLEREQSDGSLIRAEGYYDAQSSLFDVDKLCRTFLSAEDPTANQNSLVALDAIAKLHMMKFRYDEALRCLLSVGALHSSRQLPDFESEALDFSNQACSRDIDKPWQTAGVPYLYVLDIIDSHHLHQALVDSEFMKNVAKDKISPLFALLQLVGFNAMREFLVKHCVPPQYADKKALQLHEDENASASKEERRGTLPLDLVARQLESSPKILHWYLHSIFTEKPELYVRFPNTAYPPRAVTELHRRHFDLILQHGAGEERDSSLTLAAVEAYKVGSVTTQLLHFLKSALPLGGIRPEDAKSALELERAKDQDNGELSPWYALELAYIMERYGDETEAEARQILRLYMECAKSLVLAVSFAQRNESFSSILWDVIMQYCLSGNQRKEGRAEEKVDGSLFGALLEAAALSGADLAQLVTNIPPGMAIEGLRPRLVAAVADYRLKLKMHESASKAASQEMINILRELTHRSRRGVRHILSDLSSGHYQAASAHTTKAGDEGVDPSWVRENDVSQKMLTMRTVIRRDREKVCLAPAML